MLNTLRGTYPRYQAPKQDNTALVEPPLESLDLAAPPRWQDHDVTLGTRSLGSLVPQARRELLAAATTYTTTYRDLPPGLPSPAETGVPFYLTGHQAEMFHPGVWFKNFVVSRLAREQQGVAIHLVIDTDLCRTASLRIPTGSIAEPRVESVMLDSSSSVVPYEERAIVDPALFASFGPRGVEAIAPLVPHPLLREWWPAAIEAAERTGKLGLAVAQARHQLEARWGAATLEIPQSHCCQLPSFHWFAAHLLATAREFRTAHNQSLGEYRAAHQLRSLAQPIPDLALVDDWCEAPLWVWSDDNPRRRPLFVRPVGEGLELSDHAHWTATLPATSSGDYSAAVEALQAIASQGVRIRTRALSTTLFARLLLGDIFLHGIGGAKYDQVTDDLTRRWLGCDLPQYLTLSATLRLPIPHTPATPADRNQIRQQLRDLEYHPEQHLPGNAPPEALALVEQKRRGIATPKTPATAHARHQAITTANQQLQGLLEEQRRRLLELDTQLTHQTRATALLQSREYAFCLFPEENLRERMLGLAGS